MQGRARIEPGTFQAEVWFDERTETIQIKRTDASSKGQHLTCTFEQWEQIKYAVDHLFEPAEGTLSNYEEIRNVVAASRN